MPESASQYFQHFLTSETALARHYRQRSRRMAFGGATQADALAWQSKARRQLAKRLGLDCFTKCSPQAKKIESVSVGDLTRETWRIQTERDVWMPYYLFIPATTNNRRLPLVLCPHGHSSGGKWATGGRRDIPAMEPVIETYNYDYGVQLARAGFITACPDARGFGERREPAHQNDRANSQELLANSCHNLTLSGAPLGMTVQGMWAWDLMRLVDYLGEDSRIDARRIGCAGLSGGGLQTLNLAALDKRVKAAVVSGYFYGVRESLQIANANCMCNLVPRLWEDFDMGDIGALIAPRGLFVETGDEDSLNGRSGLANVRSQVRISRKVYKALASSNQLTHLVFHGAHLWNGSRAIPWLQHKLQSPESTRA